MVGAIDLHEDHALVDVESHHAELIVKKLARVRVKGVSLEPRTEPPAA
ncbi:MAG: DbpA RNA binding domain-containing protein [Opitutaceae bacterium]